VCGYDIRNEDNEQAAKRIKAGQITFYWDSGKPTCVACTRAAAKKQRRIKKIQTRRRQEAKKLSHSVSHMGEFVYHPMCLGCGNPEPFMAKGMSVGCTDACTDRLTRNAQWHWRIEAIRNAARFEHVHPGRVYASDKGCCHICSEPIPQLGTVPSTDPQAFEVDHVIPLSEGGEHSYRNVRASHKECNVSRNKGRSKQSRVSRRIAWQALQGLADDGQLFSDELFANPAPVCP